ncbi:UNVERIFIED_CONTAM: hypothetical protein RMT77_012018 [Armadillidium vulgare]|nr:Ubiquinone biosynthesis protein COQ4-like protein, mitochondrial [Armadillidium vulgare]
MIHHLRRSIIILGKEQASYPVFLHIRNVTTTVDKLYEDHIPTNFIQKSFLSVGSALTSITDPRRHDAIAVLGETTGYYALKNIYNQMLKDSEGGKIIADKPRINSKTVDINKLAAMPHDSLGHSYWQFLSVNKVTPDSRLPVRFVDNQELAYVMQRYREVHDLFHTILGMPTNMLGEVAVKWIEATQTGLPMCISGALFGPLRFRPKQRATYINKLLPWTLRTCRNAKPLMTVYFERRWEQNIQDLRNELNIETPPKI